MLAGGLLVSLHPQINISLAYPTLCFPFFATIQTPTVMMKYLALLAIAAAATAQAAPFHWDALFNMTTIFGEAHSPSSY
jgi:hypothetical protein